MQKRKWGGCRPPEKPRGEYIPHFLPSIFLALLLQAGCAAPGEPIERKPPVPEAVNDLAAAQSGNNVALTFTLPKETVERRPLKQPPAVEIYRDFVPAAAGTPSIPSAENPTLLLTIPSGMVDNYKAQGRVRFVDSLRAEDFRLHPGYQALYMVRTRASKKKGSGDSNVVALQIYPAPDPIEDLKAAVTHSGVVLTWTPPQKTLAGTTPPTALFEIFRAEPGAPAAGEAEHTKQKSAPVKIGQSESPEFKDTQFELGKTYSYSVRSVAQYSGVALESADSNLVSVTPKDTFPPAAPEGLVVVFVPATGQVPAHLDLSWAINSETDIAGYNVYRSEQLGSTGTRLNVEFLLTPAFRDMNAVPGSRYSYSVTAVDRSGNESPASAAAVAGVPSESQSAP